MLLEASYTVLELRKITVAMATVHTENSVHAGIRGKKNKNKHTLLAAPKVKVKIFPSLGNVFAGTDIFFSY